MSSHIAALTAAVPRLRAAHTTAVGRLLALTIAAVALVLSGAQAFAQPQTTPLTLTDGATDVAVRSTSTGNAVTLTDHATGLPRVEDLAHARVAVDPSTWSTGLDDWPATEGYLLTGSSERANEASTDAADTSATPAPVPLSLGWDASTLGTAGATTQFTVSATGPDNAHVYLRVVPAAVDTQNGPSRVPPAPAPQAVDLQHTVTVTTPTGTTRLNTAWLFTAPGTYTLAIGAVVRDASGTAVETLDSRPLTVIVGQDPATVTDPGATPTPPAADPAPASDDVADRAMPAEAPAASAPASDAGTTDTAAAAVPASDEAPATARVPELSADAFTALAAEGGEGSDDGPFTGDTASDTAPEAHQIDPVSKKEMLYREHVDAAHIYWDKATQELRVGVIDGVTLRPADRVLVRLGPDAEAQGREVSRLRLPDTDALHFLGKPGDIVWNAPAQFYDGWPPVWAGYGSGKMPENIDPASVSLHLERVEGPGWMSVWRSGPGWAAEDLRSDSTDRHVINMQPGDHTHSNWSFSKPGRYQTYWKATAKTKDGKLVSSPEALVTWVVGPDSAVDLPEGTTHGSPIVVPAEKFGDNGGPGGEGSNTNNDSYGTGEQADLSWAGDYTCAAPGHYDLALADSGESQTELSLHDDSGAKRVNHTSGSVVVPVPDSAASILKPSGDLAELRALGPEGTKIWTLPEQQQRHLVWFGMNTEEVDFAKLRSDGVRMHINYRVAPGRVVLWDYDIADGAHVRMNSDNSFSGLTFHDRTHRHLATSFNAPGTYEVSYESNVRYKDGAGSDEHFTVYYAVGDEAVKTACGQGYLDKYKPAKPDDKPGNNKPGGNNKPAKPGDKPSESGGSPQPISAPLPDTSALSLGSGATLSTGGLTSGGASAAGECRPVEITREATADEAATLSSGGGNASGGGGAANTASTTLTFNVGAEGNANEGHFDLGPVIDNNTLLARIKDDRHQPATWVDPASLTFGLTDAAKIKAPDALSFFTSPGSDVWLIPSTQKSGVPWLGMNSQYPEVVSQTTGEVEFTLSNVQGPGKVAVFAAGALGGGIGEHIFDGPGSTYTLPANTHAHQNWAFSAPGTYTLTIEMKVKPRNGDLKGSGGSGGAASKLVPTGEKGPNGLPMVRETVGRMPDGSPCNLSGSLAHTGANTDMLGLGAAMTAFAGGLVLLAARRLRVRTTGTKKGNQNRWC